MTKRKPTKTQKQKFIEDCNKIIKYTKILNSAAVQNFSNEIISKQQMTKVLLLSSKIKKWTEGIMQNHK
jgi:Asp-tRNA(Asn)/Glu-tRNA(Gln) amidotransferase C subunit